MLERFFSEKVVISIHKNRLLLIGLLYVVLYFGTGAIFYTQNQGWSVQESIYFAVVVCTTVGYGDFTPQSDDAKIFTFFYAFAGVGLFTFILSLRVRSVNSSDGNYLDRFFKDSLETNRRMSQLTPRNKAARARSALERLRRDEHSPGWLIIKFSFLLMVLLTVGVLFSVYELGYSFVDALYWSGITGLGVGFGDIIPSRTQDGHPSDAGICFATFYILLFICLVFYGLGEVSRFMRMRNMLDLMETTLGAELTPACLIAMDEDDSGSVDRTEWLSAMLVVNRVCDRQIIQSILQRFDELDRHNDGMLPTEDVILATSADPLVRRLAMDLRESKASKSAAEIGVARRTIRRALLKEASVTAAGLGVAVPSVAGVVIGDISPLMQDHSFVSLEQVRTELEGASPVMRRKDGGASTVPKNVTFGGVQDSAVANSDENISCNNNDNENNSKPAFINESVNEEADFMSTSNRLTESEYRPHIRSESILSADEKDMGMELVERNNSNKKKPSINSTNSNDSGNHIVARATASSSSSAPLLVSEALVDMEIQETE